MASYQKYGINPLLIAILTGKDRADIQENPTSASLPGNYASIIANRMSSTKDSQGKNNYLLTCGHCGRKGTYDLGTIVVDLTLFETPSAKDPNSVNDALKGLSFTRYFRCRHCNSAGEWVFPVSTRNKLYFDIMSKVIAKGRGFDSDSLVIGKLSTYDGQSNTFASDLESRYLGVLQQSPDDSWIWNRLGNAYYKSGRSDLAAAAYEASINYDPGQTESHFSLGQILFFHGMTDAAIPHFRLMLITARNYSRIEPLMLRELLAHALYLMWKGTDDETDRFYNYLPTATDYAAYGAENYEAEKYEVEAPTQPYVLEMELDFSSSEGLYPLAELYMGQRQKELPVGEMTLMSPRTGTNQVVHPSKKKPAKKKGKRKH